jgi:hypothetical protein
MNNILFSKRSSTIFMMFLLPLFIAYFSQYFYLLKGNFLFEKEILISSIFEILAATFLIKRLNHPFLLNVIVLLIFVMLLSLKRIIFNESYGDVYLIAIFVGFCSMAF